MSHAETLDLLLGFLGKLYGRFSYVKKRGVGEQGFGGGEPPTPLRENFFWCKNSTLEM